MRFFLLFVLIIRAAAASSPNLELVQTVFNSHIVGSAVESPIPGVFQFSQGSEVYYISADGRYVMQGEMIDLKNQQNVTESFRAAERAKMLSDLPKQHMIIFAPPQPRYTVTIFIDVNCPYCRLIQKKMPDYHRRGIEIRYLAFPRGGMNSPDAEVLKQVFCAANPAEALIAAEDDKLLMQPTTPTCPQVRKQHAVGQAMGVIGTPALVLEDGTLIPGFVAPDSLEAILKKHLSR